MSHLQHQLAGFWVSEFGIIFPADPPLQPYNDPFQRHPFSDFSPLSSLAYLQFHGSGEVEGFVWQNSGYNRLSEQPLTGSFSVGVPGGIGLAMGELRLEGATQTVRIQLVVRNLDEFYFTHREFIPKAGASDPDRRIAPLTHGVFRRATPFIADPIPLPPGHWDATDGRGGASDVVF